MTSGPLALGDLDPGAAGIGAVRKGLQQIGLKPIV